MSKHKMEIFLCVMPFILLFSPMAHVRYYFENFMGNGFEFFSEMAIYATNEKNDHEVFYTEYISDINHKNDVINIPSRYRRYKFYFSGILINGVKDVEIFVNNKQVDDVDLSFPQGMNWFWDDFYLVKNFSCHINLRSETNVITIKSGNTVQKIIVHVGSD